MAIRFSQSASRHGISQARARHVVEHCPCPLYSSEEGEEDLIAFLGPDGRGVPVEVIALELSDGELLVIHAMNLRRTYLDEYARVMSWQPR